MSRKAVARALAVAGLPRLRFNEFLAAFRAGGIEAVAALDDGQRVARALELEERYRKAGIRLDPKGQWAHEREDAARDGD